MAKIHTEALAASTVKTFSVRGSNNAGASVTVPNIYKANTSYYAKNRCNSVEVTNVTGTAPVYVRADGVDPVSGADDNFVLAAVVGSSLVLSVSETEGAVSVKCISTGTPTVSVRAL